MKKQNTIKLIISLSLILSVFANNLGLVLAQESTKNGFNPQGRFSYKIPSSAVVGSTAERRDAWNKLSDKEKAEASKTLQEIVEKAKSESAQQNSEPMSLDLSIVSGSGESNLVNSTASRNVSPGFFGSLNARLDSCEGCFPGRNSDKDGDGLFQSFEKDLADGFTPYYHVSSGEDAGTGFARFYDSVPQTVSQVFGSTPPISHFRVKPLGLHTETTEFFTDLFN